MSSSGQIVTHYISEGKYDKFARALNEALADVDPDDVLHITSSETILASDHQLDHGSGIIETRMVDYSAVVVLRVPSDALLAERALRAFEVSARIEHVQGKPFEVQRG
jgi:hypothetical protein